MGTESLTRVSIQATNSPSHISPGSARLEDPIMTRCIAFVLFAGAVLAGRQGRPPCSLRSQVPGDRRQRGLRYCRSRRRRQARRRCGRKWVSEQGVGSSPCASHRGHQWLCSNQWGVGVRSQRGRTARRRSMDFTSGEVYWYENPGGETLLRGYLWPKHLLVDTGFATNQSEPPPSSSTGDTRLGQP